MKKVTMFVWNHFTNDARVNRECTALSEKYDVNLIAIDDPKDDSVKPYEEINPHFHVTRVRRYPLVITCYQQDKNRFLITVGAVSTVISAAFLYINWMLLIYFASAMLMAAMMIKVRKFRKSFVNGAVIMRMTKEGYKQNADIYHSNDLNTLPQGIVCSKLRLKPRKLVYDSHEVQSSRTGYNPKKIKRIERFLLNFVDEMMVENHTRAKHNEDIYGFYPRTLYNYSELYNIDEKPAVNLHDKLGLPDNEKILLYQGGLQQGRGLELLIEAMPQITEGTLVFLGAGKLEKKLKELAAESPAKDRIKFIPKVHFKELPSYTREAYLGFQVLQNVCFNHYSASSNKLFEYIMAHVPVVSCSFPEVKKVVEGEEVGIAVDSHSAAEIAAAVNQLLKNPALRNRMSENCKTAKLKYNWDVEQQKLFDTYTAVENKEVSWLSTDSSRFTKDGEALV
ncbi:glycosyltransferase family 4 protein [Macrococcus brunensis]|uniref:glycosyltransferase family 4 protein n=1 Tax=Macrococcus brunensis TaxID=198483 RepID=UPI001EF00EEF|nr:glycosyltransferase family 4 protein [Macrococcus brunensis]ULG72686.1 glycosyltransferase family 4 protein [Macrococcus brunensis]